MLPGPVCGRLLDEVAGTVAGAVVFADGVVVDVEEVIVVDGDVLSVDPLPVAEPLGPLSTVSVFDVSSVVTRLELSPFASLSNVQRAPQNTAKNSAPIITMPTIVIKIEPARDVVVAGYVPVVDRLSFRLFQKLRAIVCLSTSLRFR